MLEKVNVVVCVPSTGTWKAGFGHALAMLFSEFMLWRVPELKSKKLQLMSKSGSMLVQLRHDLVRESIRVGATHILFLDSDMLFPKELLGRLLEHRKDIVGVNCTTRAFPLSQIAHDLVKGEIIDSVGKQGLEKVQHVGLAVMLIRTEVFRALRPPMFLMDWIPEAKAYCGEDVYFCQLAQAAGFDVWIDHALTPEIFHIGDLAYGVDLLGEVNDKAAETLKARANEKATRLKQHKPVYVRAEG
jgi:hypothetical protein